MSEVFADLVKPFVEFSAPLIYRLATYFTLTILDDPALLALAFC